MKKILLSVLASFYTILLMAQAPSVFNYQAVVRNSSGDLVVNQAVNFRLSILEGTSSGSAVFSETQLSSSNDYGICNLKIGNGTKIIGSIETIIWGNNSYYLKVEIDITGGDTFSEIGTVQLLSVPYALFANDVANKDDADNNPANELQNLTLDGDTLEISNGNSIVFPYDSSRWELNGNKMYYNTGNIGIGTSTPNSKLEVQADASFTASDTLFAVKDKDGNVVFAVFPDGAKVYINESAKGTVGGFAVSGRGVGKGVAEDYMVITPDSARIYINNTIETKGTVGGFAVSGRGVGKGVSNNIFLATVDSTRVYINDTYTSKGTVGGFAVSGRGVGKGGRSDYFISAPDSTRVYVKENTTKGASGGFAVGGISDQSITSTGNFLDLTPLNSFIGQEAGKSNTTGKRNAFFGYQAGMGNTEGFDNVFIGNESGLDNLSGYHNIFLGSSSGKNNTSGRYNIFVGTQSGENNTTGLSNIAIGEQAGNSLESGLKNIFIGVAAGSSNVDGLDNVFIGNFAGNKSTGSSNVYIGRTTGMNNTVGEGNVFIGEQSGRSNIEGSGNVFIGKGAGQNEHGSNRLYISNSYTTYPLIYGEFDNGLVEVRGSIKLTNILNLRPKTSFPGSPEEGDVFYDKNTHTIIFYNGTQWMELSATASISPPLLTTDSIPPLHILGTSCIVYGNISDQGGSAIIESGVCYSEIPFYDFELIYGKALSTPGLGDFVDTITGLNQYSLYYIRSFATNSEGTSMGNMIQIMTAIISYPPSVTTNTVLNITQTTATSGGDVSEPGGTELTALGICWSTTPEPTIANDTTSENIALGTFTSELSGLTAETTYYVRAYATNSNGTAYGDEVVFTSASNLPVVETNGVVGIAQTSAIGGGNVTMPGGITITAMGICWSTNSEPTIADNYTSESVVLGTFTSNLSGLTAETTYYVRAYATNSYGTTYGSDIVFTTASDITTVTDIEGNVYNTVQIGTRTWMKENLKTTQYSDGSNIPNITDNTEWNAQTEGAYCWYDNDSTTYHETYGVLYNYYAVVDNRNVCPTAWHVPTDTEWTSLSDYLGGEDIAGGKLKEAGTVHWSSDPGSDNSSGFTALPGGYRWNNYDFIEIGTGGEWWSPIEMDDGKILISYLVHNSLGIHLIGDIKNGGYSIRCIKDQ